MYHQRSIAVTRVCCWLILGLTLGNLGCSGSDPSKGITVTGTVTYDDQPLPAGQVVFELPNGEIRMGGINQGRFEVREVPVGKVRAAVRTSLMKARMLAEANYALKAGQKLEPSNLVMVPEKYEDFDSADLQVEIVPNRPITITLAR